MFKLEILTLLLISARFGLKKKNALTVLLTLEIFSLLIIMTMLLKGLDVYQGLILICIRACEGAVGLGTMISMNRTKVSTAQWI